MSKGKKEITIENIRDICHDLRYLNGTDYVLLKDIAEYGKYDIFEFADFMRKNESNFRLIIAEENGKILGRAIIDWKFW